MRIFVILALLCGGFGCALYKPARVLAPETFGLTCVQEKLCLEDPSTEAVAQTLVDDALEFVTANIGPLKEASPVLMCSTSECFSKFGNPAIAAQNVSTFGVVINDRGWTPYILRHEFIHHWQNENFGRLKASALLPRWFIEGMAYSLSGDPRAPLPREDIEAWRRLFEEWVADGNDWRVLPS